MEKDETIRTTINIPKELYEKLKEAAKDDSRSINSEMVQAIKKFIEQNR